MRPMYILCAAVFTACPRDLYRQTRNIVSASWFIQDSLNLWSSFLDVIMLGESTGV
jgi:hypothetical protein